MPGTNHWIFTLVFITEPVVFAYEKRVKRNQSWLNIRARISSSQQTVWITTHGIIICNSDSVVLLQEAKPE